MNNKNHRTLACNGCTFCCQSDSIYLHPEKGDNPDDYKTEKYRSRDVLQHKLNGDCIYLNRSTGCSIWGKQPYTCRHLDCRDWLKFSKKERIQAIKDNILTTRHVVIAKKMKAKMRWLEEKLK